MGVHQKTARGQAAIGRLSTFEGIPAALRIVRLKPGRKYTNMGELANSVGWKHKELVDKLEDKRRAKADVYFQKKKAAGALKAKAEEAAAGDLAKINETLAAAGY